MWKHCSKRWSNMLPIGCWLALFCKDISIVAIIWNWFPSPSMACSHPKCSPPLQGSLKLNFIGIIVGNPAVAGTRWIVCDSEAKTIFSFSEPVSIWLVKDAKALALQTGLHEACRLNIKHTIVEGNYMCAIWWASAIEPCRCIWIMKMW